ncbi:MAG: hypothetical protein IT447_03030 [Phycisphaerales bacterium]|jgi:hypothetical protein|nr:hypothetical protein [Phycisphaerales bacterium]
MCLIRKNTIKLAAAILGAGLAAGCQNKPMGYQEAVNESPLLVDGAMEQRNWTPVMAYYASGAVPAGGTGFLFEPSDKMPQVAQALVDPPLFAAQVVALPLTIFISQPWTLQGYHGAVVEPTYTAMPPLPTSPRESGSR